MEERPMDFPIAELMDENQCYRFLLSWLHPRGLACPRCGTREGLGIHRRHRDPVLDYQCGDCGRVFNAFTGTLFHGTQRLPSTLVLILRGVSQGTSTAQLARELHGSRPHLLELRHQLQANAQTQRDGTPLRIDTQVEADEMYQNAGEKRRKARPPRRSAKASGEQHQRPRHVGKRPATRARRRRSHQR
jgi:transposase-like protein